MEKKIKIKYWFWAIVMFGMIGIYLPIIVRSFQKSENILIHLETVFNLTTYSVSILVTSIYTIIINSSDGTNDFMNKLMDYIGYIVVAFFYVLLLNFLVSLENLYLNYWLPIVLSVLSCVIAWKMWFIANEDESFGTGALGN
jgi:hypothetical protein